MFLQMSSTEDQAQDYCDEIQTPLQPTKDNLPSDVYSVFE